MKMFHKLKAIARIWVNASKATLKIIQRPNDCSHWPNPGDIVQHFTKKRYIVKCYATCRCDVEEDQLFVASIYEVLATHSLKKGDRLIIYIPQGESFTEAAFAREVNNFLEDITRPRFTRIQ